MSNTDQFDWVSFYKEFASKLLLLRQDRIELVTNVLKIYEVTGINLPTLEKDNKLADIDPFTVFGLFNKSSMKESNRIKIISAIADIFDVSAPVPTSFDSIPVLNNQNATFYYFIGDREERDIDDLWELFESALSYASAPTADNRATLSKYFDLVINKKGNGNSKITMGLYWIAPNSFLTDEVIQPDNIYHMSGNRISVRTLDLNKDFTEISDQLNAIVKEHFLKTNLDQFKAYGSYSVGFFSIFLRKFQIGY